MFVLVWCVLMRSAWCARIYVCIVYAVYIIRMA